MTIATCPRCSNTGAVGERYCDCPVAAALQARIDADPRIAELRAQIDRNLGEPGPILVKLPSGGAVLHPPGEILPPDAKRNAEIYLDTCALGYAAAVHAGTDHEEWNASRDALHEAGIRLAAALGSLDAADRAELIALRRFREGIEALRGEVATGKTATGEPVDVALVVETIDALLFFASPNTHTAKEPSR